MLTTTRIQRICTLAIGACLALPAAAAAETVRFDTVSVGATDWTVPANVTAVTFEVVGGSGGRSGSSCTPGHGGDVTATTTVTPGEGFTIFIGGKGGDASGNHGGGGGIGYGGPGGTVLAGAGSEGGGGGGGQSYVTNNRLLLDGAGGGGCGGFASADGGNGGDATSPGADGSGSIAGHTGHAGGGAAAGGSGGADVPADANGGTAGGQRVGGWGYGSDQFVAGGGGGGSGIGGGAGGGAAAANDGSGGGGGGGGSAAGGVTGGSSHMGVAPGLGDGFVTVTYMPQPAPAVAAGGAISAGDTSENVIGTVNGEDLGTTYYVEYGTTAGYGQRTSDVRLDAKNADQPVSASLKGLAPGTGYHFRFVATNASGATRGADRTFTTSGVPLASTGAASGVSATAATLSGAVDPVGHATSYHFEIGTTTRYGLQTADAPAGDGFSEQPAAATLSGLAARTVYHYRLVATNASGTTAGADHALETLAPAPAGRPASRAPASRPHTRGTVLSIVGRPRVVRGSVRITLACRFATCHAHATLSANAGRARRHTVGSGTAVLRAGARATITISLNAAGRRLLATHRHITAQVVLSLVSGRAGSRVVASMPTILGR